MFSHYCQQITDVEHARPQKLMLGATVGGSIGAVWGCDSCSYTHLWGPKGQKHRQKRR